MNAVEFSVASPTQCNNQIRVCGVLDVSREAMATAHHKSLKLATPAGLALELVAFFCDVHRFISLLATLRESWLWNIAAHCYASTFSSRSCSLLAISKNFPLRQFGRLEFCEKYARAAASTGIGDSSAVHRPGTFSGFNGVPHPVLSIGFFADRRKSFCASLTIQLLVTCKHRQI